MRSASTRNRMRVCAVAAFSRSAGLVLLARPPGPSQGDRQRHMAVHHPGEASCGLAHDVTRVVEVQSRKLRVGRMLAINRRLPGPTLDVAVRQIEAGFNHSRGGQRMANGNADGQATLRHIILIVAMLAGIVVVGLLSGGLKRTSSTDFVFFWCFVIFAVGFAELFLLFLWLTVLGKIDLKQAFQDKELLKAGDQDKPPVSPSRLHPSLSPHVLHSA